MESVGKGLIFAGTVQEKLFQGTVGKVFISVGLGELKHYRIDLLAALLLQAFNC